MSLGLSADRRQRDRHLPQTQEEEEGNEQSHHGDAVTQEVYDHSYLVVHLAFFLKQKRSVRQTNEGSFVFYFPPLCFSIMEAGGRGGAVWHSFTQALITFTL